MSQLSHTTLALTRNAPGAVTARRGVDFLGAQATVQGQKIMGFAHADAALGEDFTVDVGGTVIAEAGAAIAVGAALIVDVTGRVIPSPGGAVTEVGDAMEVATAAGEFVEVLMRR